MEDFKLPEKKNSKKASIVMNTIHCISRHVAGFVGKNVAHDMLRGCNPGTFLLRFSEGEVGGVSVAYVSETNGGKYPIQGKNVW